MSFKKNGIATSLGVVQPAQTVKTAPEIKQDAKPEVPPKEQK